MSVYGRFESELRKRAEAILREELGMEVILKWPTGETRDRTSKEVELRVWNADKGMECRPGGTYWVNGRLAHGWTYRSSHGGASNIPRGTRDGNGCGNAGDSPGVG